MLTRIRAPSTRYNCKQSSCLQLSPAAVLGLHCGKGIRAWFAQLPYLDLGALMQEAHTEVECADDICRLAGLGHAMTELGSCSLLLIYRSVVPVHPALLPSCLATMQRLSCVMVCSKLFMSLGTSRLMLWRARIMLNIHSFAFYAAAECLRFCIVQAEVLDACCHTTWAA